MTQDDFSVCDQCLGTSATLRMVKHLNGAECRTCTRPYDVYRWNSEAIAKQSCKTLICLTCARERDCCQLCMLDIHFHIPLHIRDAALRMAGLTSDYLPTTSKNRELRAISADEAQDKQKNQDNIAIQRQEKARQLLSKLSKKLGGQTFQKPKAPTLADSASKGVDISKIVSLLPFNSLLDTANNPGLASFFVFGALDKAPQYIVSKWCSDFGPIKSLSIVGQAKCAFITFVKHENAVAFAKAVHENAVNRQNNTSTAALVVLDHKYPVRVAWGKPASLGRSNEEHRKLGLVVDKAMKQLAEKEKAGNKGQRITQGERGTTSNKQESEKLGFVKDVKDYSSSQYASLAADFEL